MRVGEAIRKYREEHSMSTADFARMVGLSRPYVYMLEVNKNSRDGKPIIPSTATLMKVSKVLNIPFTDLIDEQMLERAELPKATATDERSVITQFRKLNDADKQTICMMINRFLEPSEVSAHA